MRNLLYIILISIFFLSGCTKAPTKTSSAEYSEVITVSNYFPLKADTTLRYTGEGNEYATKEVAIEYLKGGIAQLSTVNGGTALVEIVVVGQGAVKKIFAKEESYWREEYIGQKQREEVILQQPLKLGNQWESNGKHYRISAINANVTVPYGTYKCIKVVEENGSGINTRYFAKGIGIVKEEYISGNNVVSTELTEVRNGPIEKLVELSFPKNNTYELVSNSIQIPLHTNDSLAQKLFVEMLQPPIEGVISPIPPGTKLLAFIREDNSLRLNLSSEFSNVDGEVIEERARLSALVNTFGKAFNVEGVIINIENEAYKGKNLTFSKDEVIKLE